MRGTFFHSRFLENFTRRGDYMQPHLSHERISHNTLGLYILPHLWFYKLQAFDICLELPQRNIKQLPFIVIERLNVISPNRALGPELNVLYSSACMEAVSRLSSSIPRPATSWVEDSILQFFQEKEDLGGPEWQY